MIEAKKDAESAAAEGEWRPRILNNSRSAEGLESAGRAPWRNVMEMERRKEEIKVFGDTEGKLDTVAGQFSVSNLRRRVNKKRASMGAFVFK